MVNENSSNVDVASYRSRYHGGLVKKLISRDIIFMQISNIICMLFNAKVFDEENHHILRGVVKHEVVCNGSRCWCWLRSSLSNNNNDNE